MSNIFYIIKDKQTGQYLEQFIEWTSQEYWYDWSKSLKPSCVFTFLEASDLRERYAPATGLIQQCEIREFL